MLNNLVKWTEARVPSRIPIEPSRRRRRLQYLSAVMYSFVGYQIPALIAFVGVAMGNDSYGYTPFVLLYVALTIACALVYCSVLYTRNFNARTFRLMTWTQLIFWLLELTLFVFYMDYLRPVVLLCTLLVINHLIIVGEMLICFALTIATIIIYIAVTTFAVRVAGQPFDLTMETVTIIGFLSISLYLAYMGVRLRKSRDRLHQLSEDLESTQTSLRFTMDKLEEAALKDVLTGLWNRRAALNVICEVHDAVREGKEKATLLLLDIDRFKLVNDTYGHEYGDRVLKNMAAMFVKLARGDDLVARWGGEEFLLLFRQTGLNQAHDIAERLRVEVGRMEFEHQGVTFNSTFSGGLAELRPDQTLEESLALADERLYSAKNNGRNQIFDSKC